MTYMLLCAVRMLKSLRDNKLMMEALEKTVEWLMDLHNSCFQQNREEGELMLCNGGAVPLFTLAI